MLGQPVLLVAVILLRAARQRPVVSRVAADRNCKTISAADVRKACLSRWDERRPVLIARRAVSILSSVGGMHQGGLNTKIHTVVNAQAVVIALSGGDQAGISLVEELTECLPEDSTLIGDEACDS